ncbi:hypothetical protein [Streptomyces zhihengii]
MTVLATPGIFTEFDRQDNLASDGRCKSFAAPLAPPPRARPRDRRRRPR